MKTSVRHSHATLSLRLSPSFCNYHSHNENLSLECQYLQGILAAVAERAVPVQRTTVNKRREETLQVH